MEILKTIFLAITGGLLTIVLSLIKDEVASWLPRIIDLRLGRAIARLPNEHRDRLSEEWAAHLAECPGKLTQIYLTGTFYRAAKEFDAIHCLRKIEVFCLMTLAWSAFVIPMFLLLIYRAQGLLAIILLLCMAAFNCCQVYKMVPALWRNWKAAREIRLWLFSIKRNLA